MRLTTRLSAAIDGGFLRVPTLRHDAAHYITADRRIDEDAVRRELRDKEKEFTFEDDDGRDTISFTVELVDRMKASLRELGKRTSAIVPAEPTRKKSIAEKRFDRGKFAFVRVDIRRANGAFRVAISTDNPNNAVGDTENCAHHFAQVWADNIVALADDLAAEKVAVNIVEGENCEGIVAEARLRNRVAQMRETYAVCECRHAGYCSPCRFDCPLYKDGRCTYGELAL